MSSGCAGGYPWSCGGEGAIADYLNRTDVQKALHISNPGQSRFSYRSSGPASITLHPELASKLRVLIYVRAAAPQPCDGPALARP